MHLTTYEQQHLERKEYVVPYWSLTWSETDRPMWTNRKLVVSGQTKKIGFFRCEKIQTFLCWKILSIYYFFVMWKCFINWLQWKAKLQRSHGQERKEVISYALSYFIWSHWWSNTLTDNFTCGFKGFIDLNISPGQHKELLKWHLNKWWLSAGSSQISIQGFFCELR